MSRTAYSGSREETWIHIREPHTGKLLCLFDPVRNLIEIVQRGRPTLIDLTAERAKFYDTTPPQNAP